MPKGILIVHDSNSNQAIYFCTCGYIFMVLPYYCIASMHIQRSQFST